MGPAHRRGARRFFSVEKLIAEYPRQLEYDLRAHCGVRLKDLWRDGGDLTYREVSVLFDGLPGECLTKTAIRDNLTDEQLADMAKQPRTGHGPWSHLELLTAAQIDVLRSLLYVTVVAKGGKADQPEPWPRPGVAAKKRRQIGAGQLAHLRRLAAEHEERYGDTSGRSIVLPFAPRDIGTG